MMSQLGALYVGASLMIIILTTRGVKYVPRVVNYTPIEHL
jgi:hypothetical protein